MHRQTQSRLSKYDFTPLQYVLLALLCTEDGITQQELTARATSDANTVRATLLLLERKGVLVRKSDEGDRRARRITVTAKGLRVYEQLSATLKPLQDVLLSTFSDDEAEVFVEHLNRIAEAVTQQE
jgi:DNA-binding MarR family transcriptional regulator